MSEQKALLEVKNLSVRYGLVEAVSEVSLTVEKGAIVTLIGPNGAGKTTTLSALIGLLNSTGSVHFAGHDLTGQSVSERVGQGMVLVPESRELFTDMSVRENLLLGAFLRHRRGERGLEQDLAEIYAVFPRLQEREAQLAGTLSGGERQMLAIGRALMSKPRLLLLDEPSLGLAPLVVQEIFRVIERLRETGVAVLLVEQNARAALAIADQGYVLESGRLVKQGDAGDLLRDNQLIDAYLGTGA
jgi:branched-chain amino acid transport system ATP-binding protein